MYDVVVTAVRRTKHLDAKLLRVSNNNELLARHGATLKKRETNLAQCTYLVRARTAITNVVRTYEAVPASASRCWRSFGVFAFLARGRIEN